MTSVVPEANLLTVRETAALLRQSERSILRKIHAGLIPALRLGDEGGPFRVPADELKEWLASSHVTPAERRVPKQVGAVDGAAAAGPGER